MHEDDDTFDDDGEMFPAMACELAHWVYDGSNVHPADVKEFIASAALIEHFISKGMTLQVSESERKFVRGRV